MKTIEINDDPWMRSLLIQHLAEKGPLYITVTHEAVGRRYQMRMWNGDRFGHTRKGHGDSGSAKSLLLMEVCAEDREDLLELKKILQMLLDSPHSQSGILQDAYVWKLR